MGRLRQRTCRELHLQVPERLDDRPRGAEFRPERGQVLLPYLPLVVLLSLDAAAVARSPGPNHWRSCWRRHSCRWCRSLGSFRSRSRRGRWPWRERGRIAATLPSEAGLKGCRRRSPPSACAIPPRTSGWRPDREPACGAPPWQEACPWRSGPPLCVAALWLWPWPQGRPSKVCQLGR